MAITSASLPAKKRILTACVRLFLEKGYKGTTVAEIIREADVSASSFQNIFRAKDGVLVELVEFMFGNQFGVARKIAGENASMSESYFNAGIVPGDGGAYFLPRLVGRDKALDLFWTARTLTGKEAADMGLVTHCVPDAELDAFVEQYMEKLLAAPQQAMRLTKRAVVQGEQSSLRASLDLISSFMGIVTELDDYRQRTSALVAKMQRKAQ